ncbi:hypothetical protein N665_0394s0001 [Sinapis alba]|nr:hypothetical protein N665_0394s0001 [Sinapis alba]
MAVMGHVLMITTLCQSMDTTLMKHILNHNPLITHMEPPDTKEERDDQEADQEDSWQNVDDSEISLKEASEHEEDFSRTGDIGEDVDRGERFSQSGEEESGEDFRVRDIPWCEIPYSDQEDEHQDETGSQTSVEISVEDNGDRPDSPQDIDEEEEALSEAGRNDDQPVHEEDKTAIAEDTLTEDAFNQWERDAYWRLGYDEPEATWKEMKELLYGEYVTGAGDELWNQIRVYTNPNPRRLILATRPNRKVQLKKAHHPKPSQESTLIIKGKTELTSPERVNGVHVVPSPKGKDQELSTKQLPKSNKEGKPRGQENEAAKITQEETIKEPEPQAEHKPATNVQLEQEAVPVQPVEMVQNNFVCSVFDTSKATMICLSSDKGDETGTEFSKGSSAQKKMVLKRDERIPPKEHSLFEHLLEKMVLRPAASYFKKNLQTSHQTDRPCLWMHQSSFQIR